MRSPSKIVLCMMVGVSALLTATLCAQEEHDSKGREFWMSFLPNIHSSADSLYLIITADSATSGSVEFTTFSGQAMSRSFSITDSRRAVTIGLSPQQAEIRASIMDTVFTSGSQSGKAFSTQTIHIKADKEISVTALNKGSLSSDAFLLLPVDMLGRSYLVLSYNNSPRYTPQRIPDPNQSTPSQLCIVAAYDSTVINLQLAAKSVATPQQQTIRLNKGQCFFVQAQINAADSIPADLSGSRISANKSVAVFAGQQQARLPSRDSSTSGDSRNHLAEQLIPLELWDTAMVVVPFPSVVTTTQGNDIYRVIASADNTILRVNGQPIDTLAFAEVFEAPLTEALSIESSEPVMAMQYKKSSTAQSDILGAASDASMLLAVPTSQFAKSYRFVSLQAKEGTRKSFNDQYITMVVPSDAVKSIQFDGAPISTQFTAVPASSYSVATRKIADGIHTISCDKPFGVYVYGYGISDAYSYAAGMKAHHYPYLKAHVSINDNEAKIGDSTNFVVRLESLTYPPPVLKFNPVSYTFVVRFNATLLTPLNPTYRGTIDSGYQYARFRGKTGSLTIGDTLIELPMICGLGDAEYTNVEVTDILWIDESGDTIPSAFTQRAGVFRLSDVWEDSLGKRLVNPQGTSLKMELTPNPMRDYCYISYAIPAPLLGVTLKVYDAMGNEVRNYTPDIIARQSKGLSVVMERTGLPNGVYYVRITNGLQSVVRQLILL